MRMRILQSYVNDLSEQNEVLVQTVEELEKEANDRVALLESKLQKTAGSVKVIMAIVSLSIDRRKKCLFQPSMTESKYHMLFILNIVLGLTGFKFNNLVMSHKFMPWCRKSIPYVLVRYVN